MTVHLFQWNESDQNYDFIGDVASIKVAEKVVQDQKAKGNDVVFIAW